MLYNLIITPIETIVEWIFLFTTKKMPFLGIAGAIACVSFAINFLALPLYNIADSIQEKERNVFKALEPRIKKIKKAFKGDEQFMMLQTYYRQNNYHPLYVLRSSLSILIEIPFFIAAYHFLSHCEALNDVEFLFLENLGKPDSLFTISFGTKDLTVNLLPIVMTFINFISGAIYTKGAPLREKIQLYGISVVFLVLLYWSPSGLVFYWILNNLFSLAKNIVLKTKHPKKVVHIILTLFVFSFSILFILTHSESALWKKSILIAASLLIAFIPTIAKTLSKIKIVSFFTPSVDSRQDTLLFIVSCISLALLTGLVLPSNTIASSPAEFCFIENTANPLSYIKTTLSVFIGFFIIWPMVIYCLFGNNVKKNMGVLFFVLSLTALVNAFIFKSNYGTLNSVFILESEDGIIDIPQYLKIIPFITVLIILGLFNFLSKLKKQKYLSILLVSFSIGELLFGVYKTYAINSAFLREKTIHSRKTEVTDIKPIYHLSKTEKNVVVFFIDRCIGAYIPEIFNNIPEIANAYEGFTFYPNTLSFSTFTLTAFPGMSGGYEYSLPNINKDSKTKLSVKHLHAMLTMPVMFLNKGYDVTMSDLPYEIYPDNEEVQAAYEKYPDIHNETVNGRYLTKYLEKENLPLDSNNEALTRKQAVCFSAMQILFPVLRLTFYTSIMDHYSDYKFEESFSGLYFLNDLTAFDNSRNTFTFIANETCHEYRFIQFPELVRKTDNFKTNDTNYKSNNDDDTKAYGLEAASLKQIAKWISYLKENKVYDNTRIIITSDHGWDVNPAVLNQYDNGNTIARFNPVLLFKDFNQNTEFKTDQSFMTNADTLFLAEQNLSLGKTNPFTGAELKQDKGNGVFIYPAVNREWIMGTVWNKNVFTLDKTQGWHVKYNIFSEECWQSLNK